MSDLVYLHVRVPAPHKRALEAIAKRDGHAQISATVRKMIREWLEVQQSVRKSA